MAVKTLLRRGTGMSFYNNKEDVRWAGWKMEQFYKGYRIEVSVWLDGDGWFASLFIYYSKGPQNILVTFAMPATFKTYDGAIEESLAAAQKWIDQRALISA